MLWLRGGQRSWVYVVLLKREYSCALVEGRRKELGLSSAIKEGVELCSGWGGVRSWV